MTVKELIVKLQAMPQDKPVALWVEHAGPAEVVDTNYDESQVIIADKESWN